MASELLLVGGDSKAFNEYLKDDPCLGKAFSATNDVCNQCTAPVITHGRLYLMRDICRARMQGEETPEDVLRLTSQDVLAMLQRGAPIEDIFATILNGAQAEEMAYVARQILQQRLNYLQRTYKIPIPSIPTTEELKESLNVSSTPAD